MGRWVQLGDELDPRAARAVRPTQAQPISAACWTDCWLWDRVASCTMWCCWWRVDPSRPTGYCWQPPVITSGKTHSRCAGCFTSDFSPFFFNSLYFCHSIIIIQPVQLVFRPCMSHCHSHNEFRVCFCFTSLFIVWHIRICILWLFLVPKNHAAHLLHIHVLFVVFLQTRGSKLEWMD